jgi:hypothetical protein
MRWTRQVERRTTLARTAKSCGPDIPTLISSLQNDLQATGATKPGPGENTKETVKTIAQGMPERSAYLW